jgi:hypothetical protein
MKVENIDVLLGLGIGEEIFYSLLDKRVYISDDNKHIVALEADCSIVNLTTYVGSYYVLKRNKWQSYAFDLQLGLERINDGHVSKAEILLVMLLGGFTKTLGVKHMVGEWDVCPVMVVQCWLLGKSKLEQYA